MENHVTVLEIDGNAVQHNLQYFKEKLASDTKILVVVKAFGYGSEAKKIAKLLENKVDYFAVAYTDEGIALRKAGIEKPILVLHPQIPNLELLIQHQLEPNLYNFKIFNAFLELANANVLLNYPIHLKFNTGLNRIGFCDTDIPLILSRIAATSHVKIASLFSHLAASEDANEKEFTTNQINNFKLIAKEFHQHLNYKPMVHLLNTSGIINYPQAQFDMVRLGIGLYGFANDENETKQLKNVLSLKSIISQIHTIKPGESIGYNRAYTANETMKTATIPVGHADGISRKLGNKKYSVLINNQKAPIIGNVCMDMIMVDVSNIDCKEGDEVIVFNSQEMLLKIANITNTISYEILTAISQRVKRLLKC
ncbi:alanine racemase [Polaribacter uvawellassae]|uniref:alanine racemase n=1 Tax=Polaribacter uvawellassae TaxID=3133495 RepID=UPI00321B125A